MSPPTLKTGAPPPHIAPYYAYHDQVWLPAIAIALIRRSSYVFIIILSSLRRRAIFYLFAFLFRLVNVLYIIAPRKSRSPTDGCVCSHRKLMLQEKTLTRRNGIWECKCSFCSILISSAVGSSNVSSHALCMGQRMDDELVFSISIATGVFFQAHLFTPSSTRHMSTKQCLFSFSLRIVIECNVYKSDSTQIKIKFRLLKTILLGYSFSEISRILLFVWFGLPL